MKCVLLFTDVELLRLLLENDSFIDELVATKPHTCWEHVNWKQPTQVQWTTVTLTTAWYWSRSMKQGSLVHSKYIRGVGTMLSALGSYSSKSDPLFHAWLGCNSDRLSFRFHNLTRKASRQIIEPHHALHARRVKGQPGGSPGLPSTYRCIERSAHLLAVGYPKERCARRGDIRGVYRQVRGIHGGARTTGEK